MKILEDVTIKRQPRCTKNYTDLDSISNDEHGKDIRKSDKQVTEKVLHNDADRKEFKECEQSAFYLLSVAVVKNILLT